MARHLVPPALQAPLSDIEHQCRLAADKLGEVPLGVRLIDIVVQFKALAQVGYGVGRPGDQVHPFGGGIKNFARPAGARVARVAEQQVAQARAGIDVFLRRQPGDAQRRHQGIGGQRQGDKQLVAVNRPAVVTQFQAHLWRLKLLAAAGAVVVYPLLEQVLFKAVAGIEYE